VLVLMSGRARLSILCGENGTEQALGLRYAPAILEYDEGDQPGTHSRQIAAESQCRFLAYGRSEFAALLKLFPQFAANVAVAILAERRLLMDFISGHLTTPAIGRMARYVLNRISEENSPAAGNGCCVVEMTQDDLAMHAGVSRVWVNRVMRKLIDQSIVDCSRGRIFVRNRAALRKLAFGSGLESSALEFACKPH